jgi:glutamate-ammonia-ligase adenylyltransferase
LRLAWAETCKRYAIKAERPDGLFILGLGKLGGHDLNFSSDIDLIGFYDPDILPVSANKGQAFITNQCLKTLTQILTSRNGPEHIWRVDWRLRPESSGTGLTMSTAKAEKFYFFRALPWHRLALMKARVVAGDKACGEAFLESLAPFIWPQNLDFRALDDLADLKTRINAEHPGLMQEREAHAPITPLAEGFNLKLGSGGIREIEFIANAQQLIWGGKQTKLRTTNTRNALSALTSLEHLSPEDSETLRQHYVKLRDIENAVQMLRNEQTHIVPDNKDDKDALLSLTGYSDWEALSKEIFDIRQSVNGYFSKLFEAETVANASETHATELTTLSTVGQDIAESWRNGFDAHGLQPSLKGKYQALGERLLDRVFSSVADTEMALENIDRFLKSISRSAQYLDLLDRHEALLDTIITPLLHSSHMTSLLEQSPHIIDIFLLPQFSETPNASAVLSDQDYGLRLDRLRRFVNEHLFYYYHRFMEKDDSLKTLQNNLTQLAEVTIETSITIVKEELALEPLPMTVLGLGKMGTRTMAPKSDLDLVFIFDDTVESEKASQIVRRLRTTLTTPLKEGIAYELDMRLRPSGRSGPPAVKLSSFKNHHENRAHSWEHIALAHARCVAGDLTLGKKVEGFCQDILSRPRNDVQFLQDAKIMWGRIQAERIMETDESHCNAKLRPGGLMQAQYIQACRAVLGLPVSDALEAAIEFWQYQQIWERLLGLKTKPFSHVPERFHQKVFQNQGKNLSLKNYIRAQAKHAKIVRSLTNTLFTKVELPDDETSYHIEWITSK